MTVPIAPPSRSGRRSVGFLLAFALANAGGVVAYLPLLSLLLPLKIEAMAGELRLAVFSATVIAGAVAASGSNILFGWLSDRSVARGGGRRGWFAAGIVLTSLSYVGVARAVTPVAIVLAILGFQFAVNALLAPLLAIMADEIPDAQIGVAGGLLALATPIASGVSVVLLTIDAFDETARFAVVALAVAACTLPLLAARARRADPAPASTAPPRRDLLVAWSARLLMQIAGNVVSVYLLYYFESVVRGAPPALLAGRVGNVLTLAYIAPLPIAVLLGRLSDRIGRRKPVLLGSALLAALGLLGMAVARDWTTGVAGFALYVIGSAVFLAIHAAFSIQLLPDPRHRGRDLGLLNLANTLPALIGPALTWWLASPRDFAPLMVVLAAITFAGGAVMLAVGGRR